MPAAGVGRLVKDEGELEGTAFVRVCGGTLGGQPGVRREDGLSPSVQGSRVIPWRTFMSLQMTSILIVRRQ